MGQDPSAELVGVAERLREQVALGRSPEAADALHALANSAASVGGAWSGSPIGYHSRIYYADFERTPAGARFSIEWGFQEAFSNFTAGNWKEYTFESVTNAIRGEAGSPDLSVAESRSSAARRALDEEKVKVDSILTIFLASRSDGLIETLKTQAANVTAPTVMQFQRATLPTGNIISRDMQAMTEGMQIAPHFAIQAETAALNAPFDACDELAAIAARAGDHIGRLSRSRAVSF